MSTISTSETTQRPLRLVLFSHYHLGIYNLAMSWAARHGHSFKLLVTSPGPAVVRSTQYQAIIAAAPPEQEILVTTRMRRLASYLAPLNPDLIMLFGWWYRVPPDVLALPRLGTVNFHDAALPRCRGPNGTARTVYAGQPIGVTAHRVDPGIDTGPILYQQQSPLPHDLSPESVRAVQFQLVEAVLEEGMARAIAGDPGEPQDPSLATYAGPFTDEEKRLDWDRPKAVLRYQAAGLKIVEATALARLDDRDVAIDTIEPLDGERPDKPVGTVLDRDGESATLVVANGVVRIRAWPLTNRPV